MEEPGFPPVVHETSCGVCGDFTKKRSLYNYYLWV